MTHSDIYTKFLIEYDKANVTSSYPSLTEYETAVLLDKAYLALIALKLTGNNARGTGFESDAKSIEDIRPLITTTSLSKGVSPVAGMASNQVYYIIPSDYLYYVSSKVNGIPTMMISHEDAQNFKASPINKPWIKNPVVYAEGSALHMLHDDSILDDAQLDVTYITKPIAFANNVDYTMDTDSTFECSDSMAEELINLAIVMASEIVESQRLNTKINTRQLES